MTTSLRAHVASRLTQALVAGALLCGAAAQAAPVVDTDNVSAVKENKRVAIERFGIEFYTQLYGEGRSSTNTVRMKSELEGIADDTRKAITQQAYRDTVQALTQAGFEVVPHSELAAQPLFQKLDAEYGHASPFVVEDEQLLQGGKQISRIVAPEGMKAYFQSGSARGNLSQRIEAQNQGIGQRQGELAKALNATLLQVHVLASFGTVSATKNSGLRLFAGLAARAAVEAQPVLFAQETQIQIVNTSGSRTFGNSRRMGHTGAVYLKEPLVAGDNIFSLRDTLPQSAKDKQTALNVVTGLLGGGSEREGTSAVTARSEEAYRSTYQGLVREAIDGMVAALGTAP
jgi:hypothetical protein